MDQISFFTYTPKNTVIHKTHPTLKIILIALLSIKVMRGDLAVQFYSMGVIMISYFISQIPVKSLIKELKYTLFLTITLTLFNYLLGDYSFRDSLDLSILYSIRIFSVITLGSVFINTTKPQDITPGIYNIFRIKKLSEYISLTIKLIPTFLIGWSRVNESLKSRGLYLSRNPFRLMKHISIPLLVETFKRADTIAVSMESRAYKGWIKTDIENKKMPVYLIVPVILPYLLQIGMLLLQD